MTGHGMEFSEEEFDRMLSGGQAIVSLSFEDLIELRKAVWYSSEAWAFIGYRLDQIQFELQCDCAVRLGLRTKEWAEEAKRSRRLKEERLKEEQDAEEKAAARIGPHNIVADAGVGDTSVTVSGEVS